MKKVLAVVLTVAFVSMWAYAATAQIPHVVVFFDEHWTQTTEVCPGAGVFDTLYVVAINFDMWMSAIEYSIDYPPSVSWFADVPNSPLNIGNTPGGVATTWNLPQNAFAPLGVMNVIVEWNFNDCGPPNAGNYITVKPHPVTTFLRAARWPDNVLFEGIGLASVVCPVVPVEEKTWGGVKALYDN
jgi:hypothetical protein